MTGKNEAKAESIVQLYEQGELHQHYLASPEISGDEFRRCFLKENPFSIYFLAQLIEEATGESTAATDVYKLLTKKQQKRVINPKAYSKEKFFFLFRFIRSATDIKLRKLFWKGMVAVLEFSIWQGIWWLMVHANRFP